MTHLFDIRKDAYLKIIAILLTLSTLAGFYNFGDIYFILLGLFSLAIIQKTGKCWKVGMGMVGLFLFACALSLLYNNPPPIFNSWNRYWVFLLVIFVFSPLFYSSIANSYRERLLLYILDGCVILSIGSFVAYFMGINLFVHYGRKMEITDIGHFSGIMNHSIALGHFAGLSTLYMLVKALSNKGYKRNAYVICVICCMSACFLSASRNAVISCLIGIVAIFVSFYRLNFFAGLKTLIISSLLLVATYPIWKPGVSAVITKNDYNIEVGGTSYYSREKKIDARISEFKSSPILGIGYYAIDPLQDVVRDQTGRIEPGSSWLAVASMTGILGFICFFFIFLFSFLQSWKIRNRVTATLLFSLLCYYSVHMIFEGYIIAPRSIYSLVFWLIVSAIFANSHQKNSTIEL